MIWSFKAKPTDNIIPPVGYEGQENKVYTQAQMEELIETLEPDEIREILWGGYPFVPHVIQKGNKKIEKRNERGEEIFGRENRMF